MKMGWRLPMPEPGGIATSCVPPGIKLRVPGHYGRFRTFGPLGKAAGFSSWETVSQSEMKKDLGAEYPGFPDPSSLLCTKLLLIYRQRLAAIWEEA
jgi:hypothetical protein